MNETGERSEKLRQEYVFRINRVIDFIDTHVDEELSLEKLADRACFSPYHFHRIFRSLVGEPLFQFIQRIRLERSAMQLTGNRSKSITAIAFDCGFGSSAGFSRAFRQYFGVSPTAWRQGRDEKSKIGKEKSNYYHLNGNEGKDAVSINTYFDGKTNTITWRCRMTHQMECQVQVKELPAWTVAYARHIGPYKGDSELFEKLFSRVMTWAGPRGLLNFPETKVLAVYHDDPKVTDEDKLRTSAGISVPADTQADGDIGIMSLPGGSYAVGHFEIASDEFEGAWDMMFGSWLPQSGYQPDDRACFELCLNNPREHPEGKHLVDICIPVKPL